ncbi:hypothetical protein GTQ43_29340 [Nostoc sp. KVJ3]|uniref:hypothetical protein n=1 Tax=Nostoc sp. KVJ3 TaxID=457945 RepID=UPI00223758FB|nr:hypothetical protein [Nostoc sp. KVJ3]MCW5317734.1 hypothetical protein [Nostoc sp. KVJ3]
MENETQNESQELSVQELINISGGIAIGEPYPVGSPTDDKYNNLSETIAKYIEDKNLPYWNDKYSNSQTHTSDSSS